MMTHEQFKAWIVSHYGFTLPTKCTYVAPSTSEIRSDETSTHRPDALRKRRSLIPSIPHKTGKVDGQIVCVSCQSPVTPGLCRSGSVLIGIGFLTQTKPNPIYTQDEHGHLTHAGGMIVKHHAYARRDKGFLCDRCASEYRTVEMRDGSREPIVKVDPLPGWNELAKGTLERS